MPKDDDLPKRIEADFQRTGLGNVDPEKLIDFLESYERSMAAAEHARNRKGRDFEDALSATDAASEEPE